MAQLSDQWFDIAKSFSYTDSEQNDFSYIREYMKLMLPKSSEVGTSEQKIRRFMLAGLFLTYRAANHSGAEMTTEEVFDPSDHLFYRLILYKRFTGEQIENTRDYLQRIDYKKLFLRGVLIGWGRSLAHFVQHG